MRRILISIVILLIILALGCEVSEDKTGGIPSNPITPPRVAIKSGPTGMINTPDISFTWENVTPYEPKPVLLYSYRLVGKSDNWSAWTSATEVDYTYLLDGKYTFEVKTIDLAGHVSDEPATRSFTLDTVPPNTLIKSGPSGVISTNKVVFTWLGSDNLTPTPQLLYSYRLHNTLWSTWISATQAEITDLSEGEYTFYVRAKDQAGNIEANPATRSFTVIKQSPANNPPIAKASANPTSGQAPLTVNFTGSGSDSDGVIVSYSWDFGDGATSSQQNPTHTYQSNGSYIATLTVTDDDGATGRDSVIISVQSEPQPTVDVRIVHIEYDAPGDDNQNPNGEYVEIRNYGSTINLKDWTISDKANHVYKFYSFTLLENGVVYLHSGQGTDTATKLYWGFNHAVWNNDGDTAYLRDNTGKLIDMYSYIGSSKDL